jgi:hypothetical protein
MADLIGPLWSYLYNFLTQTWPHYLISNAGTFAYIMLLLMAGLVCGKLMKKVVVGVLNGTGMGKMSTNRTWNEMLKMTGYRGSVVQLIGDLVKWIVYILFLASAVQMIGLPGLADIFTKIATFVPRFIVAILITIVGLIIADFCGKVFGEAGAKFLGEDSIGRFSGGLAKYMVIFISLTMVLAMIGLDTSALLMLFGAMLVSFILMFAFGLKDILPNLTAGMHLKPRLKPGTCIEFAGYVGTVEKVEALSTIIKSGKETVTIPNSVLINTPVKMTAGNK